MYNPDAASLVEHFPVFRNRSNCFVTEYKIDEKNKNAFEHKWKNLTRYCQKQEGYLFTQLYKVSDNANSNFDYIQFQQWVTPQMLTRTSENIKYKELSNGLKAESKCLLYKLVADDTDFTPESLSVVSD
eukprot:GHVL01040536.1.p1 GENE.GHVL01040536.1~~GHVL01040536.1.p1  ORF type:complete len:129 (+),score=28.01 GHVL01040536.1:137-523(+)